MGQKVCTCSYRGKQNHLRPPKYNVFTQRQQHSTFLLMLLWLLVQARHCALRQGSTVVFKLAIYFIWIFLHPNKSPREKDTKCSHRTTPAIFSSCSYMPVTGSMAEAGNIFWVTQYPFFPIYILKEKKNWSLASKLQKKGLG